MSGVTVELVADRPNVELRRDRDGTRVVVLAFPYDRSFDLARSIPPALDWDRREWLAPVSDWAGMKVAELLSETPS